MSMAYDELAHFQKCHQVEKTLPRIEKQIVSGIPMVTLISVSVSVFVESHVYNP